MIPDGPFRRDLCESAKKGMLCIDDLCRTGETLCGFDLQEYQDLLEEDEICTFDFDAHYPIDDGSEDESDDSI
jgi:hypothetical protein